MLRPRSRRQPRPRPSPLSLPRQRPSKAASPSPSPSPSASSPALQASLPLALTASPGIEIVEEGEKRANLDVGAEQDSFDTCFEHARIERREPATRVAAACDLGARHINRRKQRRPTAPRDRGGHPQPSRKASDAPSGARTARRLWYRRHAQDGYPADRARRAVRSGWRRDRQSHCARRDPQLGAEMLQGRGAAATTSVAVEETSKLGNRATAYAATRPPAAARPLPVRASV